MKTLVIFAAATVVAAAASTPTATPTGSVAGDRFDHATHGALTGDCAMCHAGITTGESAYPEPSLCASCHDGEQMRTVDWSPPTGPSPAGLAFSHTAHPALECAQCHQSDGDLVRANTEGCLSCHGIAEHQNTAVSDCELCHVQMPAPTSHAFAWREQHASEAAASPAACANCHVRADCLDCHRPDAASPAGGYHPADFLAGHPAASYNRQTECSTCHNPGQFCQSCHRQAGLVSGGKAIGAGYHDGNRNFISGHGQVARQNLESCVACHTESDCLRCHTRFNPHGSDFDAETWREKNPTVCLACHGANIPGDDDG
jgi:predicted CXXCH cytochrome family protein